MVVRTRNTKMWYTEKQLAQIVDHYFATLFCTKVEELFQGEFTDFRPVNKSTIVSIVNISCTEYSVWNEATKVEKTALTPQKVEEICKSVFATLYFNQMTHTEPKCFQNYDVKSIGGLTYTSTSRRSSERIKASVFPKCLCFGVPIRVFGGMGR